MYAILMVTFTINIPQRLAYIPYMDPMGIDVFSKDGAVGIHESHEYPSPLGPHFWGIDPLESQCFLGYKSSNLRGKGSTQEAPRCRRF